MRVRMCVCEQSKRYWGRPHQVLRLEETTTLHTNNGNLQRFWRRLNCSIHHRVAAMRRCVAVWCSVLQHVAACRSVSQRVAACCSVL